MSGEGYSFGNPLTLMGADGMSLPPQGGSSLDDILYGTAQKYGIPADAFRRFAEIESTLDPNARAKNSSAKGLFQITDPTAKLLNLSDPFNAAANADAAARLWKQNEVGLTDALGRAPSPGELYLAHQQGLNGAKLLLRNPSAKAVDLLGRKQVLNNGGSADMSAGDFAQQWLGKFAPAPAEQPAPKAFNIDEMFNPISSAHADERPQATDDFTRLMQKPFVAQDNSARALGVGDQFKSAVRQGLTTHPDLLAAGILGKNLLYNPLVASLEGTKSAMTGEFGAPGSREFSEAAIPTGQAAASLGFVSGMPMAEPAALGSAGGKLLQGAENAKPFYSALAKGVESAPLKSAPGEQWLGTLKNTAGIKQEELDWLGLPEWLKEQKGNVSKADVSKFVGEHQVDVQDVLKGGIADDQLGRFKGELKGNQKLLQDHYEELNNLHNELAANKDMPGILPAYSRRMGERINEVQGWIVKRNKIISDLEDKIAQQPDNPVKFHDYQLPGGENYREMLLTMPPNRTALDAAAQEGYGANFRDLHPDLQEMVKNGVARQSSPFTSSHFEEPNVLAHTRFNDRVDANGKKTLFLEEIQSDWHQKGRKQGYAEPVDLAPLEQASTNARKALSEATQNSWRKFTDGKATSLREAGDYGYGMDTVKAVNLFQHTNPDFRQLQKEAQDTANAHAAAMQKRDTAVPNAPFKTSWPELALKRMIRYAAEHGYDSVSWTPGDVQAARYDLSKRIKKLVWNPQNKRLMAIDHNRHEVMNQTVEPDKLPDYIGKEAADKLLNVQPNQYGIHNLDGQDLQVGGEGMKGFYDKILPSVANKLGKKFGSKVGTTKVKTGNNSGPIKTDAELVDYARRTGRNLAELKRIRDEYAAKQGMSEVWHLPITPAMRSSALGEGFPLFTSGVPIIHTDRDGRKHKLTPVDHNPFAPNLLSPSNNQSEALKYLSKEQSDYVAKLHSMTPAERKAEGFSGDNVPLDEFFDVWWKKHPVEVTKKMKEQIEMGIKIEEAEGRMK